MIWGMVIEHLDIIGLIVMMRADARVLKGLIESQTRISGIWNESLQLVYHCVRD
jgi:hypothetical protein